MNYPIKCPQCGEEFDSMDSVSDSQAMVRLHREAEHGVPYPDLIMLSWRSERSRALAMGWAPENILGVTVEHFEGRRYSSIHITWRALEIMGTFSPILEQISQDQLRSGVKATIGHVVPPPALLHGKGN